MPPLVVYNNKGQISMVTQTGERVWVEPDQYWASIDIGWRPQGQKEEHRSTTAEQLGAAGAFGSGLSRGLTLGLSDVATKHFGGALTAEGVAQAGEEHPLASMAGEAAGMLAPVGPIGMVGKAAMGAKGLRKAGGLALEGAMMGGASTGGRIALMSEQMGREEMKTKLLKGIGYGAALNMTSVLALSGVSHLARKAMSARAQAAVSKLDDITSARTKLAEEISEAGVREREILQQLGYRVDKGQAKVVADEALSRVQSKVDPYAPTGIADDVSAITGAAGPAAMGMGKRAAGVSGDDAAMLAAMKAHGGAEPGVRGAALGDVAIQAAQQRGAQMGFPAGGRVIDDMAPDWSSAVIKNMPFREATEAARSAIRKARGRPESIKDILKGLRAHPAHPAAQRAARRSTGRLEKELDDLRRDVSRKEDKIRGYQKREDDLLYGKGSASVRRNILREAAGWILGGAAGGVVGGAVGGMLFPRMMRYVGSKMGARAARRGVSGKAVSGDVPAMAAAAGIGSDMSRLLRTGGIVWSSDEIADISADLNRYNPGSVPLAGVPPAAAQVVRDKAGAAAQFLASKAPQNPDPNRLGKWRANSKQARKFGHALNAVLDPNRAIARVLFGLATEEEMEAIQTISPDVWQEIVAEAKQLIETWKIGEQDITKQDARTLHRITGDPSLLPFIMSGRMVGRFAELRNPPEGPQPQPQRGTDSLRKGYSPATPSQGMDERLQR